MYAERPDRFSRRLLDDLAYGSRPASIPSSRTMCRQIGRNLQYCVWKGGQTAILRIGLSYAIVGKQFPLCRAVGSTRLAIVLWSGGVRSCSFFFPTRNSLFAYNRCTNKGNIPTSNGSQSHKTLFSISQPQLLMSAIRTTLLVDK